MLASDDVREYSNSSDRPPHLPADAHRHRRRGCLGNALPAVTATIAQAAQLTDTDIGVLGDPSVPGVLWINGANSYTMQCEGSDIGNNDDGFNFAYQQVSGDFDVRRESRG